MGFIQHPQILRLERIKQFNYVHLSLCQLTPVAQLGMLFRTRGDHLTLSLTSFSMKMVSVNENLQKRISWKGMQIDIFT